jgi:hypothetical protein
MLLLLFIHEESPKHPRDRRLDDPNLDEAAKRKSLSLLETELQPVIH